MSRTSPAASALGRLRRLVFPPCGWRRAALYHWKRLIRLDGTAHSVAFGAAIGVFVSFTPLLGGRIFIAGAMAAGLRASVLAAVAGTQFGNPLVYPALFVACVEFGAWMLGVEGLGAADLAHLRSVLGPALLGIAVAGGLTSLAAYVLVLRGVRAYQRKRRARIGSARRLERTVPCATAEAKPI
ncbi:DUF2062 domain-containing protein [Prosthecomicrobium sp. N25]|uniref:DUF2062 domain-containing protein n=1 Tax=Prosthecomicrobium sp. N25 TaxID=3129254 RepID=UPI0030784F70